VRSRLRLFALVGLLATSVDVGLLTVLEPVIGALPADVAALTAASVTSYLANRWITYRGSRSARWVRRPSLFVAIAVGAGAVDVAILVGLRAAGLGLLAAKAVGVVAAAGLRWTGYRRVLFNQVRRELAQQADRPPPPGDLRLTVVLPAYNEADRIAGTVATITAELESRLGRGDFEIMVVDDGSTDATVTVAERAGARVVAQPANRGKGAAVRAGMLAARGRAVVFTDADLAYPPQVVLEVMDRVEDGWDVVVGSRRHEDANTLVRARRLRELGGRVINLLTYLVLLGAFRDTQCGIKGFRRDIATVLFQRTRIDGFAFDVEIFLIAEQDRMSLSEVAVSVRNRSGSSVRVVGDTIIVLRDLIRIRRWAGAGHYRPDAHQAAVLAATRSQPAGEPGRS
jgi:putative flippase GtrA